MNLITDFKECFPENLISEHWIRDPFYRAGILAELLTTNNKDEVIEISCNASFQHIFKKIDLAEFWLAR
jgi:hypothetical protein